MGRGVADSQVDVAILGGAIVFWWVLLLRGLEVNTRARESHYIVKPKSDMNMVQKKPLDEKVNK